MERQCKHQKEYYTCKRMKLLIFLRNKGFIPEETTYDLHNPKYLVWRFKNSPELESAIEEYFSQLNK